MGAVGGFSPARGMVDCPGPKLLSSGHLTACFVLIRRVAAPLNPVEKSPIR